MVNFLKISDISDFSNQRWVTMGDIKHALIRSINNFKLDCFLAIYTPSVEKQLQLSLTATLAGVRSAGL